MKKVESQYNHWPYPEPILDLKDKIEEGFFYDLHLNIFERIIFPEGKDYSSKNILIAGCGTNQALYYALSYPEMDIYGIDLSEGSISHNKDMIKKYGIKNLKVEQRDIFDIKDKDKYDVIVATGVVHHTKDPSKTIIKLSEMGTNDCALVIGVYSSYLRYGVYSMQKIFNLLNLKQSNEDINFIKRFLNQIPSTHPVHRYINVSDDLLTDAGVIDTFLHPQDISFDTSDLKNLINQSGLIFQSWFDNIFHYYNQYTFKDTVRNEDHYNKFNQKLENLDYWEQLEISHNINFGLGMFNFILRKEKSFEFIWHDINSLKKETNIIHRPGINVIEKAKLLLDYGGKIERQVSTSSKVKYNFNSKEGILWSPVSDKESNTLNDVIKRANEFCLMNKVNIDYELDYSKSFFHKMWKHGYIIFGL